MQTKKFSIYRKNHKSQKLSKGAFLVGKKVRYNFPMTLHDNFSTLHAVNGRFIFLANYSHSHSSDTGAKKKKKVSIKLHIVTHPCSFMAPNSKIWGVQKKAEFFGHFNNRLPNSQLVTYSKMQTKVCRIP